MKNKTKSEEMYENMSKEEKDFILYMSSVNRYGIMSPEEYLFGKKPVYEFESVDDDTMRIVKRYK